MQNSQTTDGAKRTLGDDVPPAKRRRLSETKVTDEAAQTAPQPISIPFDLEQAEKEARVGISAFVDPKSSGFSGVLKQRCVECQDLIILM